MLDKESEESILNCKSVDPACIDPTEDAFKSGLDEGRTISSHKLLDPSIERLDWTVLTVHELFNYVSARGTRRLLRATFGGLDPTPSLSWVFGRVCGHSPLHSSSKLGSLPVSTLEVGYVLRGSLKSHILENTQTAAAARLTRRAPPQPAVRGPFRWGTVINIEFSSCVLQCFASRACVDVERGCRNLGCVRPMPSAPLWETQCPLV